MDGAHDIMGSSAGGAERAYRDAAIDISNELAEARGAFLESALDDAAFRMGRLVGFGFDRAEAGSFLASGAQRCGLAVEIGTDAVQSAIATGIDGGEHAAAEEMAETADQPPCKTEEPSCDWSSRVIDSESLIGVPAPIRRWTVPDWVPQSDVTLCGADGGVGKTTLMLQLGCARAWGQPWLGLAAAPGNTLHCFAEEDGNEVHYRFAEVSAPYVGKQLHKLYMVPLASEECVLATPGPNDIMEPAHRRLEWLEAFIVEHEITLAILDAQADMFGGNEVSRSQVRSFIRLLRAIAIRHSCAIVLTAHPSVDGMKTGRGYSGSTHWNNAVRSRLYFTTPTTSDGSEQDQDLRCLELAKSNRARRGQQIMLRWQDGRFQPIEGAIEGLLPLLDAKAKFMEMVAAYQRQGRRVGPYAGRGYAPAEFMKESSMEKFTKALLEKAMNALLSEGRLAVKEMGSPSKRVSFLAVE